MIYTFSKFYYGYTVTDSNQYIDFDEGGDEINGAVTIGDYTLTSILEAVETALNADGALVYTVTADRDTRKITISATGTFSLLVTTGTNASYSIYSLLGFTSDKTGLTTYTSDVASGYEYIPQFKLQSYVGPEDNLELVKATINEASDGTVEIITFGEKKFIDGDIQYITNRPQPSNGPIRSNPTGVEDARSFMNAAINKAKMEFMPDYENEDTYYTVLLESSEESSEGTAYMLKEEFGQLPDYYKTGVLTWRVIE